MPTIDLKPATQDLAGRWNNGLGPTSTNYWTVHPSGTAVAALSDTSTSTYLELNYSVSPEIDDDLYGLGTATLAANQRVTAVRLRVNMLKYTTTLTGYPSGASPGLMTWYFYASDTPSSHPAVLTGSFATPATRPMHWFPTPGVSYLGPRIEARVDSVRNPSAAPSLPAVQYPAWQYTTGQLDVPGIYYSGWHAAPDNNVAPGGFWSQAMLNNAAVLLTMRDSTGVFRTGVVDAQWAEIALEVDVRTQPSVVVAQGVGTPLGATVTWTSTLNDGDVQSAWEMALFAQATTTTPGFDPAITHALFRVAGRGGAQTAGAATGPGALLAGQTYVAYVRVAKTMGVDTNGIFAAGSRSYDWYSNWASNTVFISPVDTATYTPALPNEGILGCHAWSVTAGSRGGTAVRDEIPWSRFTWSRKLQEVSAASVTFPRSACTKIPFLADMRSWEHELAFWRDSEAGAKAEWVGPITGRTIDRDTITLRGRDWFTLFEHRRVHGDYNLAAVELATLFSAVALDALGPDNSAKIGIVIHASGVAADRQYFSTQYRRSADVLREIGRAGIDWTMVGRVLLAGGVELGVASCRLLLDEHVIEISGDENGESAATDVTVVGGKGTGGTQAVAGAAVAGDPRGVLETVIQANDIQDNPSALAYASSSLALLGGGVPRSYELTLGPATQSGYGRLIPGARWPVDIPSIGLFETLRLRQVDVTVERSEDGQVSEMVKVQLTSLGQLGF